MYAPTVITLSVVAKNVIVDLDDGFINLVSFEIKFLFGKYISYSPFIINSGYNPKAIIWGDNLTKKEIQLKDKIVNKYVWSYLEGYKLKGENK